jgi:hypothetical protein
MNATVVPRQLVLLCDGTNNNLTGGRDDTNVVRLAELMGVCPDPQRLIYYDPGVGNAGELPGATLWDTARRASERVAGLAFGRGVYENMVDSYQFLMNHCQPGDQIFVFGFSRGAFTARSVAGLVNQFGLLAPHMVSMLPTLLHLYFSDRGDAELWKNISAQASRLFATEQARAVEIQFVGVWDTVATVGMWPFEARFTALPTLAGKRYVHVRHALALDEQRAQFKPRLYAEPNGPYRTQSGQAGSVRQLWFRGVHCDVGGGFEPAQAVLARAALCWMASEAVQCGLRLQHQGQALATEPAVAHVLAGLPADAPPQAQALLHSELHDTCLWALTGMVVRDAHHVCLDGLPDVPITPEAHPSVAALATRWPQDSVWQRQRRPAGAFWASVALAPLLVLALGRLLLGPQPPTGAAWQQLWVLLCANADFARWQVQAPWHDGLAMSRTFVSPRWALLGDLAFIASYAYLLSWLASWAFARRAALRQTGDHAPLWLNRLGWALPLAVGADLGEDLFTWLTLTLFGMGAPGLAWLCSVPMALCALAKWAGLAGTLALIGWGGLLPRR